MSRRDRMERRAERRDEWAEGRERKAEQADKAAREVLDNIPLGQPILVGHHSEKRHRRTLERAHGQLDKAIEHDTMANHHKDKAAGIRDQLDRSVFSDDPDAIERLIERIDEREQERDRMKAVNAWFAKHGPFGRSRRLPNAPGCKWKMADEALPQAKDAYLEATKEGIITQDEAVDMIRNNANGMVSVLGFPPYALQNLGSNINRDKKRLKALEESASAVADAAYHSMAANGDV